MIWSCEVTWQIKYIISPLPEDPQTPHEMPRDSLKNLDLNFYKIAATKLGYVPSSPISYFRVKYCWGYWILRLWWRDGTFLTRIWKISLLTTFNHRMIFRILFLHFHLLKTCFCFDYQRFRQSSMSYTQYIIFNVILGNKSSGKADDWLGLGDDLTDQLGVNGTDDVFSPRRNKKTAKGFCFEYLKLV